jgi:hypothetical protein
MRRPLISSPGIPVERGAATVVDEKGICEPLEKKRKTVVCIATGQTARFSM